MTMPDQLDALVRNINGTQAAGGLAEPEEAEDGSGGSIPPAATKALGALAGANALGGDDDQQAVGDIGGRKAAVIHGDDDGSGIEQIASAAASIAMLGLPAAKITAAVGSKL